MTTATNGSIDRRGIEEALAQPTLCAAFQLTARTCAHQGALRTVGGSDVITWSEYANQVQAIATGLAAIGVGAGDVVCMMVGNRVEFHPIDIAVIHLGAAACSMYLTNPASKLEPLVRNADARVIVTEVAYLDRIMEVADRVGHVERVVIVDGRPGDDARQIALADLAQLPAPPGFDFEASWRAVAPETIASLGHTSGTTGEAKGVEFSHGAMMFNINSINRLAPPTPRGRFISYLPMAHLGERYMSHYSSLAFGYELFTLADGRRIGEALREVHPTRFFSVPRVYEKLAAAALEIVAGNPEYARAYAIGVERVRAAQGGQPLTGAALADAEAANEVLGPVREAVGLDQAEYLGVGAAAPPVAVLERLHALGLPALECYGLSETALVLSNRPDDIRLGTVGLPMPGIEAQIAEDGELLIRGRALFTRYRHEPELTRQAIDSDGWFHTGDVAERDADGYYKIVDRKKELLVTATGKNVAPLQIENLVRQGALVISQVVAVGDARRFIAALIVLDPDVLAARGVEGGVAAGATDPRVHDEVAAAVAAANEKLSQADQIRAWQVLSNEWLPGGDELTTTAKLRRRVVNEKYASEIEALYRA